MSNATDAFDESALLCPECDTISPTADWPDTEVGCELCGEHQAIKCPNCGERFEHVWGYDMIRRAMEETRDSEAHGRV
jgi:ribosomal protein S27E